MIEYTIHYNEKTGEKYYTLSNPISYYSPRYSKCVFIPKGYRSDGASGPAIDIASESWWVHDFVCEFGTWGDGSPVSLWQEAMLLHDIFDQEGRWFRKYSWPFFTLPYRRIITRGKRKLF